MVMRFWRRRYFQVREKLYRQSLPGFSAIPIAIILKFVWKEIWTDDIITRSNSMAFSFFLSIFPGLLVMLTLLPYFPIENLIPRKIFLRIFVWEKKFFFDSWVTKPTFCEPRPPLRERTQLFARRVPLEAPQAKIFGVGPPQAKNF